jgi:hypothetical protein
LFLVLPNGENHRHCGEQRDWHQRGCAPIQNLVLRLIAFLPRLARVNGLRADVVPNPPTLCAAGIFGSLFAFRDACRDLGIKHISTKPYTPKTNGRPSASSRPHFGM